jgi:hypothetical protein
VMELLGVRRARRRAGAQAPAGPAHGARPAAAGRGGRRAAGLGRRAGARLVLVTMVRGHGGPRDRRRLER